jgi:hypothetical protein
MVYVKGGPDRVTHFNLPLQIIVSSGVKHEFAYTEKADSLHEIIDMDDGTELKGKYFDGEWMVNAGRNAVLGFGIYSLASF